jgi:hypothetical protein
MIGLCRIYGAFLPAFLCLAAGAFAELPVISLNTLMPPGGKIGTEVEVTITGADLDEASGLLFSDPRITAKPKTDKQFVVTIPSDVPVGVYDVRIAGRFGVSNPRRFVIGVLPETIEKQPNDKPEAAVELAIGSVHSGTVASAAADYFKFTARKGQRVFVECAAPEIDSRLVPVLAVSDGSRELEVNRRGGLIDFTAPADGSYLVRLHDLTYAGSAEHFYRLSLTSGPRVDFIFPPSGPAGTKSHFTLYGRGLPGGAPAGLATANGKPLEKLEVEIELPKPGRSCTDGLSAPAAAPVDGFSYRFESPQGVANPVFISFAGAPLTVEQEPKQPPAPPQKVEVPCEVAGQFHPARDTDAFQFDAKKGDVYSIEVFSDRLGLPTKPLLLVQREGADSQEVYAADANAGGPRFNIAHNDPMTRLEVKADGSYQVKVRDLFGNTRSDPRCVYRLVIRKESPDFRLAAIPEFPPKNNDDRTATPRALVLRGGETAPLRVVAFRRDGFAGEIELSGEGLPDGVTCVPAKIAAGKADALLLLTATEDATRWIGPIRIVGKARAGDTEVARDAVAGVVAWNVADYNNVPIVSRLTQEFTMGVTNGEKAPVSIEPAEDKVWEVAAGSKLEIPLKITRRGGFTEPLKLKAYDAPAIEGLKEIDVAAGAATATVVIDLAAVKIPAGLHTIHFRAQTKGKFRDKDTTFSLFSRPMRIRVK